MKIISMLHKKLHILADNANKEQLKTDDLDNAETAFQHFMQQVSKIVKCEKDIYGEECKQHFYLDINYTVQQNLPKFANLKKWKIYFSISCLQL